MAERKPVSTRTRFEVFKRDNFTCQYCGATPPAVILHVDHIVAVSKGGSNVKSNLVTSCSRCNLGKSNISLSSVPKSLAEQAAEIKEREKQLKAYRKIIQDHEDRVKRDAWDVVHALYGEHCNEINRSYISSIKRFLELLPLHEVVDSAEIAFERVGAKTSRFTYFCAICWKKIKGNNNG